MTGFRDGRLDVPTGCAGGGDLRAAQPPGRQLPLVAGLPVRILRGLNWTGPWCWTP